MFYSKALKNELFREKKYSKLKVVAYLQKGLEFLASYTTDILSKYYYRYSERIGRSFAFAKIGWLNYDFDFHPLYDLMTFKLKRIHKALINGSAKQSKEDMDALKEAIKITKRLGKEDYEWVYHRKHDRKWGQIRTKFTPYYNDKGEKQGSTWNTWRKGAKTKSQKKQERKEFKQCWIDGEKDRITDLDRLNELFKKYANHWWD